MFHPQLKEESGLFCFLSPDRACGPDCMAYDSPPLHKDFVGKQWAHCTLLVNMHRVGKHLTVLANTIDNIDRRQDNSTRIQPPPKVQ